MPTAYTVKQGDHLSRIADQFGFSDYRVIWDYAGNADLKAQRKNPHVLFPGDSVIIPDKEQRVEDCGTDQRHTFQVEKQNLTLRIVVKDFDDLPVKNTDCELQIDDATYKLKTDGDGKIVKDISRTAMNGTLRIPELSIEMPILIGHLDPTAEDTGWQGRLANLGYNPGETGQADGDQLRSAIEEFQCDYKLPVTGELDAATKAKLEQIHGC
jgi:N-acetylmuramoyl-L-alanine amidase